MVSKLKYVEIVGDLNQQALLLLTLVENAKCRMKKTDNTEELQYLESFVIEQIRRIKDITKIGNQILNC